MNENPLIKHFTSLASDLIKNTDSGKRSENGFHPNRELFKHEKYFYDCFQGMGTIHTLMRQLDQSAVFFANFRSTKSMKKLDINRFDHMVYHLESYVLRITGILDRLLIFVNQVIGLGLEDASCKPHMMLTGKNGKIGPVTSRVKAIGGLFESLVSVRSFVDKYREQRNEVAHSNRWEAQDMRRIEMLHIVLSKTEDPEILEREFIIKRETDLKMWEYKAQMINSTEKLKTLVADVFAILLVCFDDKYNSLKN
ncbi:Cthe_2314 family HEPN domain-containing protein [Pedobacter nyackensis]|uniref:Cthe_2314 family HEPN domain-containing protein n=1 Tax=Pedobacter nyackensis TaxID=475255 RepID=UPI00292EF8D4|nr:Cthe_2314 family HEPN domain-containing protein [Pedobacter nyackensis]